MMSDHPSLPARGPSVASLVTTAGHDLATQTQAMNQAMVLMRNGQPGKATAILAGIVDAEPHFTDAYVALGCCHLQSGRTTDAIAALGSATALDAYHPAAFANLGLAYTATRQFDEARACFERALMLTPDHPVYRCNYAGMLVAAGDIDGAMEQYRHALAADSGHPMACREMAKILRHQGKRMAAAALLRHATATTPGDHALWLQLSETLVELGRVEEAYEASEQARAIDPTHADGLMIHGRILLARGACTEAAQTLAQAAALRPNAMVPRFLLGEAQRGQGNYPAAIAQWSALIQRFPRSPQPYLGLARTLIDTGNADGARRCLDRVAEMQPDAGERLWLQAELDLRQGYVTKAWPVLAEQIRPLAAEPEAARPPLWDGSPLAGRRLLVDARLPLTETILLARLLALASLQDGPVRVLARPDMAQLLSTVPGVEGAYGHPRGAYAGADLWCSLSGLAVVLAPRREALTALTPSLRAPAALVQRMAEQVQGGESRPWLGLVAPPPEQADRLGSVIDGVLADGRWNIAWIAPSADAAQPPLPRLSLPRLPGGPAADGTAPRIVTLTADRPVDTAAALSVVDHVIAVDSPAAHLAGALGRPGHILVRPSGHWCWGYQPASLWYPTLTAIRREPAEGDWTAALGRLMAALPADTTGHTSGDDGD